MLAGVPVTEQINQHYKRTRQKEKENSQEGNDIQNGQALQIKRSQATFEISAQYNMVNKEKNFTVGV